MIALVLALTACSGPDPITLAPVDGPGPLAVGTFEGETNGATPLPVQFWYPTADTTGEHFAFPADAELGAAFADAAPLCVAPRPVVVFSHGNGGIRYQSVFLMEHLASHGFVVVAPDHVGNTLFDDGDVSRVDVALRRPLDVAAAFDDAVERSAGNGPLHGCVDPDAGYAVVGHSFGAWTTLATAGASVDLAGLDTVCAAGDDFLCGLQTGWTGPADQLADPRVWAAVPISPVGIQSLGAGLADIAVPTLVIGGEVDTLTPWDLEVAPIYDALTVPARALAQVARTGHYGFTDFCLSGLFPNCDGDILPLEEAHRATNGLVLAWLAQVHGTDGVVLPPTDDAVVWASP